MLVVESVSCMQGRPFNPLFPSRWPYILLHSSLGHLFAAVQMFMARQSCSQLFPFHWVEDCTPPSFGPAGVILTILEGFTVCLKDLEGFYMVPSQFCSSLFIPSFPQAGLTRLAEA